MLLYYRQTVRRTSKTSLFNCKVPGLNGKSLKTARRGPVNSTLKVFAGKRLNCAAKGTEPLIAEFFLYPLFPRLFSNGVSDFLVVSYSSCDALRCRRDAAFSGRLVEIEWWDSEDDRATRETSIALTIDLYSAASPANNGCPRDPG